MEQVLFNRLKTVVLSTLGPEFATDLSKLATLIATFVDQEGSKILKDLNIDEKLELSLTWLQKLLAEAGKHLEAETLALIHSFLIRIYEAASGMLPLTPLPKDSAVTKAPEAISPEAGPASAPAPQQPTTQSTPATDSGSASGASVKKKNSFGLKKATP